ncbi:MAG: putative septation protein SpoVG [Phycisphaerae bacterium]|nr:putative septation protein SpoVG [Phycisphaerae bacterium]
MDITEVRVKLVDRPSDRLKAFCTVTFDNEFVVRDLKVIAGPDGYFVAMPSRKLTDHCPKCGAKNHLRASFCNECGAKLSLERNATDDKGRAKLHADVAHPINARCRQKVQDAVVAAYEKELADSKLPGYKPRSMDYDDDTDFDDLVRSLNRPGQAASPKPGDTPSFGQGIM